MNLMNCWGVLKNRLKQKYDQLTDNDLAYVKDGEEEILDRIAKKTGATRDELEQYVREASASARRGGSRLILRNAWHAASPESTGWRQSGRQTNLLASSALSRSRALKPDISSAHGHHLPLD